VGLASRGPCGHDEVRLDDGDGWNRPVHVRSRASSSAACAPAYPRRYRSIQGHGELDGVLMSRPVQRNRRITHRGARSTFAGGRVKSGGLDPASLARQSSILRSGSFTEARGVSPVGWTGMGMAWLASLRWRVLGRPLARRVHDKLRRSRAPVKSRARGGVRLKPWLAL
jgi:hypothetical protein